MSSHAYIYMKNPHSNTEIHDDKNEGTANYTQLNKQWSFHVAYNRTVIFLKQYVLQNIQKSQVSLDMLN